MSPPTLRTYLPAPAGLCGLAMSASMPMNKVAGAMLLGLWEQVQRGLTVEQGAALAKSLLEVVAAAYAVEYGCQAERSVIAASRYTEIKHYIEMHLRNPELGPTPIANALGVSRRYIRLLFAAHSDSVTAYIRRRRLEAVRVGAFAAALAGSIDHLDRIGLGVPEHGSFHASVQRPLWRDADRVQARQAELTGELGTPERAVTTRAARPLDEIRRSIHHSLYGDRLVCAIVRHFRLQQRAMLGTL